MLDWLWLVPAFPFLGFLLLLAFSEKGSTLWVSIIGVGSVGLAALTTLFIAVEFLTENYGGNVQQTLWIWMEAGSFQPGFSFYLDGLSLSMLFVITGVGFLIHLYASAYMQDDPDFARFFVYTNLFVAAMVILVLADNYALLFLGWEGVGLCSFLLIGFWYKNPENGLAARKAFIITRAGDTAFAIGLFLLFKHVGTLDIQLAMIKASTLWHNDSSTAALIALLLLGGAVGKSAQLPLQTWLPDAMAGPTPVSALIHAATMVTAGVYLIARSHVLFELSPGVMYLVALVGMITLLMSGLSALNQTDLKRILAYSTISQIGYMFLALGVGAWTSAIFHLMTHAFFKALLFLTAGSVILALHHEQNIFRMGGLHKSLRFPFLVFFVGCLCLAGMPLTSGFVSKEEIISVAWFSDTGGVLIWSGAVLGAFLTGLYTFRMCFIVFFGEQITQPHEPTGVRFSLPLIVLAVLALVGGAFYLPLKGALPQVYIEHPPLPYLILAIASPILGVMLAYQLYYRKSELKEKFSQHIIIKYLSSFFKNGWELDRAYRFFLVVPYVFLSKINRLDLFDKISHGTSEFAQLMHRQLSMSQTGQLRFYVGSMTSAALVLIILSLIYFY